MLRLNIQQIEPDASTCYLVGPEGLVWTQPSLGDPYIIAARDGQERLRAAAAIAELLAMGLVPYGMPLNQRAAVALFGGSAIRDCQWVPWASAPAPAGDLGDPLPAVAMVVVP
jgi:hypothetical protein